MGKLSISMTIFNSYVSLPEGKEMLWIALVPKNGEEKATMMRVVEYDSNMTHMTWYFTGCYGEKNRDDPNLPKLILFFLAPGN